MRLRELVPFAVVTLLAAALALPQTPPAPQQGQATEEESLGFGDDAEAVALFASLAGGKLIAAREGAEKALTANPQSYAAEFVLGYVLHEAEGNLPLAYHHLSRARQLFERAHGPRPGPEEPWRWHLMTLQELASVAREMDRYEEALGLMDAHDVAYDPDEVAARAWPLLRLRRYEDARKAAMSGVASSDPREKQRGRTALCAIEAELLRRQAAYDACLAALRAEPAATAGPHLYTNAASSALELLRMDEAERLLLEGTRHFDAGNAANPWLDLMTLYLGGGRSAQAVDALRRMIQWRRAQPPYMDQQTGAETEYAAALFLTAAGRGAEAARITARILARPDRTGFTSAESSQMEAATALLDRAALRLLSERTAEDAASSQGWPRLRGWASAQRIALQGWSSGRRASERVRDERMLVATLRPYLPGGVAIPAWMAGDLVAVLGPGVMAAAIARARRDEDLAGASSYFDAWLAEASLARGRLDEAFGLAAEAAAGLPTGEALLRCRTLMVQGQAALERGDVSGAARIMAEAWQIDPGMVRRLGLALPAAVLAADGGLAARAAVLLKRSPRLRAADAAFLVTVENQGAGGRACLVGPAGETLACADARRKADESDEQLATRLATAFHEQAFAMRTDLTQSDLQSLDGATTVGRARSEEKLQGVIDELSGGR